MHFPNRAAFIQTLNHPDYHEMHRHRDAGLLCQELRKAERKPAARAYDAMIAAIAISNGLPLHTCNPRDFTGIDELTIFAYASFHSYIMALSTSEI